MELEKFIKIFKKDLLVLIICVSLGLAAALIFSGLQKDGVTVQQTFYITSRISPNTANDIYDGFYREERLRNFTDTAVSLLQTPDLFEGTDLGVVVSTRKLSPQLIRITVKAATSQSATAAIQSTTLAFNTKMESLEKNSPLVLEPISNSPQIQKTGTNQVLMAASGLGAGLILGIFLVSTKFYLKL